MAAIITAALALAEHGRPVFPCGANKRPITRRGFRDAATDATAVRRMFRHPAAQLIGLPTGPASGIDVLDLDPRHGSNEWLAANCHRLPATRTHRSRSGGLHYLFAHTDGVRNSASRIAPGIDVRGEGGYIVCPPSPGYSVELAAPIAPWPSWLLQPGLVLPTKPVPATASISSGDEPAAIADARYAGFVRALLRKVSEAQAGEKRATLIRMGRALGGVAGAAGITDADAVRKLVEALPDGVEDWDAARTTAAWAVGEGRKTTITLADREMGAPR